MYDDPSGHMQMLVEGIERYEPEIEEFGSKALEALKYGGAFVATSALGLVGIKISKGTTKTDKAAKPCPAPANPAIAKSKKKTATQTSTTDTSKSKYKTKSGQSSASSTKGNKKKDDGQKDNKENKGKESKKTNKGDSKTKGDSKSGETNKSKNKPKQQGKPNSVEYQRDANGNITKYTEYDSNGKFVKEVRITGKDHGGVPRPNVKEPNYNIDPSTGIAYQNGYKVRPAQPWEIPIKK